MIFKSVLKYKIFEWCLDALVNKLLTNFNQLPTGSEIKVENLTKDMRLSRIEIGTRSVSMIYYGCNIVYFNHIGEMNWSNVKDDIYDISFSFDKKYTSMDRSVEIIGDSKSNIWWMVRANDPNIKFFL